MAEVDDYDRAMSEARAFLRLSAPFFAALVGGSPVVRDLDIPTACVNEAGVIRINPNFFLSLDVVGRATLLAHEIMHPAWGVFWRAKMSGHCGHLSNVAHDHVINLVIAGSYPGWGIPGWLCDERYEGLSYEQVYSEIERQAPKGGGAGGRGMRKGREGGIPGAGDDVRPDGSGSIDSSRDEALWRSRVVGAFQSAVAMGSVPAGLERAITGLLDPEVDWRDRMRRAVCDAIGRIRVDWASPDRRSDGVGIHIPSEISLGHQVSVAIDSSGSVSEANLRRACSEIMGIVEEAGGEGKVLVGDAAVHGEMVLRDFEASMLVGGGGTSFVPVFEHLEIHPTRMLIYFTDTFGTFPEREPEYPVIWAVYESAARTARVPFGEVVIIPDE